jgi:hypothetical protein
MSRAERQERRPRASRSPPWHNGSNVGLLVSVMPAKAAGPARRRRGTMIRKLASGEYRLYSRKKDPETGKRRNLGTFASKAAAQKHEREVQYFKRH